jgi:hypothetical protein
MKKKLIKRRNITRRNKIRRNKKNNRFSKKRVGGKVFTILNWDNLTVPEKKAATMNIHGNTGVEFLNRMGVVGPEQEAHMKLQLGTIYYSGFRKLPGDETGDFETAYQNALQPIDRNKIHYSD